MQDNSDSAEHELRKQFLLAGVEDDRPTWQKDAVDEEFHMSNGLALPRYTPGRLKMILASSTSGFSDWGSMQSGSTQVCNCSAPPD